MTKDDVIRLAMNSGLPSKEAAQHQMWWLEAFAKLIAEHEREACANVAREWVKAYPHPSGIIANNIMARGQA